ncbi:ATP-dependent endonuclease of the OLD family protein [Psychromonas sp. CNPT3]|uniref:DUF2813 domain-containing protein n=1 Tax=Psychromonas sp. CNPT3 TaxID=314282 RepID=UPI00006E5054|nr:DUF2813 domain-containing protein [Psychromonas sp. CNPT3]AGH82434.1 ATP-dependent endonuclease of the OLD family protein [Psychromonas sp. CNPT3]
MLLDKIEIVGFRGINRLSLQIKELNAFLGENSWGKSSLFDALSLFLSGSNKSYKFTAEDFHQPPNETLAPAKSIHLVFTFKEQHQGESLENRYKSIYPIWNQEKKGLRYIYYQVDAEYNASSNLITRRYFLNNKGEEKFSGVTDLASLVNEFLSFVPVLRMGGEPQRVQQDDCEATRCSQRERSEARIRHIFTNLTHSSQQLSDNQRGQGYEALAYLFDHYLFKRYAGIDQHGIDFKHDIQTPHGFSFSVLTDFNALLKSGNKKDRAMLLLILGEFLQARGNQLLRRGATPILLLEDPENDLHPVNLAITWRFFSLLPMQKLVFTNSSQLLSFFPLSRIQRLVRYPEVIKSYALNVENFSDSDLRKITFHVRMNRPQSLFARAWLLVEGETETWLLTELARLCDQHFIVEGVQIIEFAQCGLSPLIKLAQDLNIEWHVLTDGDMAGQKYASRVVEMLHSGDPLTNRLTLLPAFDIEHFLFENGFADVYYQAAGLNNRELGSLSRQKVIYKAVHKHSKPELALAITSAASERGADSIPPLLKRLFARLIGLARTQSG